MVNVEVKDNANTIHQMNADAVSSGETQVVKLQVGDAGTDEGFVSSNNPLSVFVDFLVKSALRQLSKLSFDGSGQLRATVAGTVGLSSNQTLGTLTTGNISFGDAGKPATNIIYTRRTTETNLIRS